MKRIISLCCIALILVTSMAVPIQASEKKFYLDVLDYCTINDSGSNVFPVFGSTILSFSADFPQSNICYFDILYFTDGYVNGFGLPNISIVHPAGIEYPLTVIPIGDGYFRAYGDVGSYNLFGNVKIKVYFDDSSDYKGLFEFHSIKAFSCDSSLTLIEAYAEVSSYKFSDTIHYVPTDEVNHRYFTADQDFTNNFLSVFAWTDEWKKYDFIDFMFTISASSINSVACFMGQNIVPIDVSIFSSAHDVYNDFFITIRMDLTSLDRTTSDYPMILIEGNVISGGLTGVAVVNVAGGLWTETHDPELTLLQRIILAISNGFSSMNFWINSQTSALIDSISASFTDLNSWINAQTYDLFTKIDGAASVIISAIRGDTSPGNEFQEEVDQKDQDLDEMAAVMDSVTKPPVDQINVSVDSIVSPADVQLLATPMAVFFDGQIFSQMIVMSILLATVSFVLFGKR